MSSYTKPQIYNLALSALLLAREVSDTVTDQSNEVRVLNTHYDVALSTTLQDLDLTSTSKELTLELFADLRSDTTSLWDYVYKYPVDCVFLRRIKSSVVTDNKYTHISKRLGHYNGNRAIYTNEANAVADCVTKDIDLALLSPQAGLALAYKLAYLSAPLIVGKGAKTLRKEIQAEYLITKEKAEEIDSLENFNYESDYQRSEFVYERLS